MEIIQIDRHSLYKLETLWRKLNKLHCENSTYFKDHFRNISYEERCEKLDEAQELGVFIAKSGAETIGYCIVSYHQGVGEIDSLYVTAAQRSKNIGQQLTERALNWLQGFECEKIVASVSEGNESVIRFYQQHGFEKRSYLLQKKQ